MTSVGDQGEPFLWSVLMSWYAIGTAFTLSNASGHIATRRKVSLEHLGSVLIAKKAGLFLK